MSGGEVTAGRTEPQCGTCWSGRGCVRFPFRAGHCPNFNGAGRGKNLLSHPQMEPTHLIVGRSGTDALRKLALQSA
ncbi:hypothetical protein [Deinococcus cavernae]|uniref:hypothetical protein n=1 Tax=Deinococcus cavernae TaxID=2320857 RepID=UPI001F33C314|nr:hypothetical protein [Deinococcus cavernae]